jgi:hypothetical protein
MESLVFASAIRELPKKFGPNLGAIGVSSPDPLLSRLLRSLCPCLFLFGQPTVNGVFID